MKELNADDLDDIYRILERLNVIEDDKIPRIDKEESKKTKKRKVLFNNFANQYCGTIKKNLLINKKNNFSKK